MKHIHVYQQRKDAVWGWRCKCGHEAVPAGRLEYVPDWAQVVAETP